jgi:hypothetical protein
LKPNKLEIQYAHGPPLWAFFADKCGGKGGLLKTNIGVFKENSPSRTFGRELRKLTAEGE